MWRIYLFPYAHFWFLQAILLLFAAVSFLDHRRLMDSLGKYMLVLTLVLTAHFAVRSSSEVFSLKQALYLAPFFFVGIGANRFKERLSTSPAKLLCAAIFALTMALYVIACLKGDPDLPERATFWATTLSISGCLTLLYWVPRVKWLGWVGGFSFTVYLYHVFFTAGTRLTLNMIGDFSVHVHFAVGLLAGITGPILVELLLRRNALARRTMLGQS
jgi:surface polysaccharide O-acyltransferase-like enzyme